MLLSLILARHLNSVPLKVKATMEIIRTSYVSEIVFQCMLQRETLVKRSMHIALVLIISRGLLSV